MEATMEHPCPVAGQIFAKGGCAAWCALPARRRARAHMWPNPNAQPAQFTFAGVTMTGESHYRGAVVVFSADFPGAATRAHWTSAKVERH